MDYLPVNPTSPPALSPAPYASLLKTRTLLADPDNYDISLLIFEKIDMARSIMDAVRLI